MKILVNKDIYNICSRIRNYDPSYRVVFDTQNQVYQVYSTNLLENCEIISGKRLSYVLTLPYKCLDARAFQYLYDTEVHDFDEWLNDIDVQNELVEKACARQSIDNSLLKAENQLRKLTK